MAESHGIGITPRQLPGRRALVSLGLGLTQDLLRIPQGL
jgi:hypothetical protein